MREIYFKIRNFAENWRANLLRLIFIITLAFSIYFMIKQIYILGVLNTIITIILLPLLIITFPIKQYKTYFDRSDTPFVQEWQSKRKYQIAWKRMPYTSFLGHKTVKVKWLGLITIHHNEEV